MGKNSKQEFDKKYWENFYDSDSNFKILCGNTAAFVQAWPRNQANFSKHIKTEPNHFKFLYIKISQITQNLAQNIGQTKIICNMKFISSLFFFLKNGLKYKTQFFLFSELIQCGILFIQIQMTTGNKNIFYFEKLFVEILLLKDKYNLNSDKLMLQPIDGDSN